MEAAAAALYFADLRNYLPSDAVAALLLWSSIPVSSTFAPNDLFWDFRDPQLLSQIGSQQATVNGLVTTLTRAEQQLAEAGSAEAGFFSPSLVSRFVQQALSPGGVQFLDALLIVEESLVEGAADALKQASGFSSAAGARPSQAMAMLADFTSSLTSTFNSKASSIYSGVSGRLVGPMLFLEASAALGAAGVKPNAMMQIYALKKGHAFSLGSFVDGAVPGAGDVALTQTLVSLGSVG